jgi:fatty-acyl-CoA synthase
MRRTVSAIVDVFGRYPDREAFVLGERRISYREGAGSISQIEQLLSSLGITYKGQVAALSKIAPKVWFIQAAAYLFGARAIGLLDGQAA